MQIEIKEAILKEELVEILALQEKNHREVLVVEKGLENGFLSVRHNLNLLEQMNNKAPQVIGKVNNKVIAFALVMLESFKDSVPALIPMFETLGEVSYKGKKITLYNYYVMGQICVDESYRSMGVFDRLYEKHKEVYSKRFDICVTEISSKNLRSMAAHKRVGFEVVYTFKDQTDEWNIVVWDWK